MSALIIRRAGPALTVQDLGRPGHIASGLSCGGAADRHGLIEGAALLGQDMSCAALEMAGFGGTFETRGDLRIALTGAPMKATLDGQPMLWNASHHLRDGQILEIAGASTGLYGYLHVGGGIATDPFMGSRATHLVCGIGALLTHGSELPIGQDQTPDAPSLTLPPVNRFSGGVVRILPSVQTDRFAHETLARFQSTVFTRSPRGNRQGAELQYDGAPFTCADQLSILSEPMVAGDIQMTGDGAPFVLLPECQTTGGYPRIATVLPDDLPMVAQAGQGVALNFRFVERADAVAAHRPLNQRYADLKRSLQPLLRDPHDIRDLLSYQLISGVVSGEEPA